MASARTSADFRWVERTPEELLALHEELRQKTFARMREMGLEISVDTRPLAEQPTQPVAPVKVTRRNAPRVNEAQPTARTLEEADNAGLLGRRGSIPAGMPGGTPGWAVTATLPSGEVRVFAEGLADRNEARRLRRAFRKEHANMGTGLRFNLREIA